MPDLLSRVLELSADDAVQMVGSSLLPDRTEVKDAESV